MIGAAPAFAVVGYGVDDLTLGFDMTGSRAIGRLNSMTGTETRRGKMLGHPASWGKWSHLLGRSASFWKSDTSRLYVQAKLAAEGELCAPTDLGRRVNDLVDRMALVGLVSFDEPWVTRIDVAVDAECRPADGKLLLDALEAVPLPRGWRTCSVGCPRSTVYFKARASEHVLARAYCRNLKTKQGAPFCRIRLEAEQRFDPRTVTLDQAAETQFPASVWKARYGNLTSRVTRLAREIQTVGIAERVEHGELSYSQGERLAAFLDLERLGLAKSYYPKSAYADRRRLAAKTGYSPNEMGCEALDVDLAALLSAYVGAVDSGSELPRRPLGRQAVDAAGSEVDLLLLRE